MRKGEQSTWKPATLENGLEVDVPLFVANGDTLRIEVATRRYLERLRDPGRH
jgi:elongation factor P